VSGLRRLNDAGIAVFQRFLDSFTTDEPHPYPEAILSDPAWSEAVEPDVILERREFSSRLQLAQYLHDQFEAAGFRPSLMDRGLWAWIACLLFPVICPVDRNGKLDPGRSARWIPETTDWRRYYRHLVAGPYRIFLAHRDDPTRALAVLCQKPGRPGDLVEQLASRQEIVTNPAIISIATECFVDPVTGRPRPSASRKGAGGPRRFVGVLDQFDLTWDLSLVPRELLLNMLPREFFVQR
jgi:hypothetical protein